MAAKRCKCERKRTTKPYGQRRVLVWCDYCDANLVPERKKINKKRERQKAKKEIQNDT